jgi:hypothetical protein
MPTTEPSKPRRTKLRHGFRFALVGLLIGFLGLGIAAYRMSIEAEAPTPPNRKEISDVLSDTIQKTADKLRHRKPAAPPPPAPETWPTSKKLGLAASICGFIALVFGSVSWLVGEHRRWTWAALCVGIAALAWTHVVVAVSIAVAFAIAIWILGQM